MDNKVNPTVEEMKAAFRALTVGYRARGATIRFINEAMDTVQDEMRDSLPGNDTPENAFPG
ncbi:hypothetical protein [Methylopila sp. 73B]|uniref:hypothetical protein n=1 Tax=Methylopila sp. 73B TaxID=1120792 RepID=UPI0012DEC5B1|nr:hypothetical protein [Methylopila sp. 73B]